MKEMNGVQPFVYVSTCGCVFSQAGLKMLISSKEKGKEKETSDSRDSVGDVVELCPNCGTKYFKDDVIALNPSSEEEEILRLIIERRRSQEPKKKSKKRKNDSPTAEGEPAKKKVVAPIINAGAVTSTSRAVASELEMEEQKRKANMSAAVKSLYGNGTARKETFMTRDTFTRVSFYPLDLSKLIPIPFSMLDASDCFRLV